MSTDRWPKQSKRVAALYVQDSPKDTNGSIMYDSVRKSNVDVDKKDH